MDCNNSPNISVVDIDCAQQVRFRRSSFRSLIQCMVPTCCAFQRSSNLPNLDHHSSTTIVTGTFFGYRKGRVSFCLQDSSTRNNSPLLLLEFTVPTSYLAREMQSGILRIALECSSSSSSSDRHHGQIKEMRSSLYGVGVWSMYCNGRKVGFAIRRQMGETDAAVLKLMQSVSVGAGVLPVAGSKSEEDGDLMMYLRASFERVVGSVDSESFHMLNPGAGGGGGSNCHQELSIFLLRS